MNWFQLEVEADKWEELTQLLTELNKDEYL